MFTMTQHTAGCHDKCDLAGATSTVGLYPLETLRTRLAMGDYKNMLHAVRVISAEEGFMAFYQVRIAC